MRITQFFGTAVVVFLVLLSGVMADNEQVVLTDPCYVPVVSHDMTGALTMVSVSDDCGGSTVTWNGYLNLTVLGNISDDEIIMSNEWIFVDSALRPDLDASARLLFADTSFAVEPNVLKDGTSCLSPQCNVTFFNGNIVIDVNGFSNYSLTARQDFVVYSDTAPEMDKKVYQTIDLGDANRGTEFACIVQVFGSSVEYPGQWVLVQTNPEREVQGKLLGNPDANQPESLGYFKTTGGMANVYFRDQNIPGYSDFEYVAQCSSNSTKLIFEEPISTRYHPMGRTVIARGVWLTSGTNVLYLIIEILAGVILLLLVVKAGKTWFGR